MASSHWWQRWATPIKPGNPFKQDLEDLSPFFVRSEVGESSESSATETPCAKSNTTPRAKSSNPFRSDDDSGFAETSAPITSSVSSPMVTARPSLLVPSAHPFRSEESDSSNLAKSFELTAERKLRKPVKLPEDFDGKQPLKEYLMHFERCALINGWNQEEKAMFLTASLRGESRKLLSGLTVSDGQQYAKIVERLELRFGVEKQAELHQARLLNRRQFEGESLQMLATDIRSLVDLAYQDVNTPVQERFAVQHFIDALSEKDDRLYLRREKPSTLDEALSLARELESLRLLDSNNSFRRAGSKVRAMETERTQLQMQVDGLQNKIDQQQQQLEAQENIITQLNEFLPRQRQSQSNNTNRNQGSQGSQRRGWECWNCGERGHLRKECPRLRGRSAPSQPSGNGNRVSPRSREDA